MSKFIDSLMTKSASEAVEILATKYAEIQEAKRANHVKSAGIREMYDSALQSFADMPEESRRAIIGGAAGAGIGGLGSLGIGYIKNKKLKLSDALYGALAGAVPGAAIGALTADIPVLAGTGTGTDPGTETKTPEDSAILGTTVVGGGGLLLGGAAGRGTAGLVGKGLGYHEPRLLPPADIIAAMAKKPVDQTAGEQHSVKTYQEGLKADKNQRLGHSKYGPSRGKFNQLLTLVGMAGGTGLGGYMGNQGAKATGWIPKMINPWIDGPPPAATQKKPNP